MPDPSDDGWPDTVGLVDGSPSAVAPQEEIPVQSSGYAMRRPSVVSARGALSGADGRLVAGLVPAVGPSLIAGVGSLLLLPPQFSWLCPLVVAGCAAAAGLSALRRGSQAGWIAASVLVAMVGVGQTWAAVPVLTAALVAVWAAAGGGRRG